MWEIIPYISTPIALLALGFVIYYGIRRASIKADLGKFDGLESKDKSRVLLEIEEKYNIRTGDLTKDQRFQLVNKQLDERSKQRRDQMYFALALAIIFLGFLVFSILSTKGKQESDPDLSDIEVPTIQDPASDLVDSLQRNGIEVSKQLSDSLRVRSDTTIKAGSISVSKPAFNVTDPSKAIKLVFRSRLLSKVDTINAPVNFTSKELLSMLLSSYELNKLAKERNVRADSISWNLIHENKKVAPADMARPITQLKWVNHDNISLEYLCYSTEVATIYSDYNFPEFKTKLHVGFTTSYPYMESMSLMPNVGASWQFGRELKAIDENRAFYNVQIARLLNDMKKFD